MMVSYSELIGEEVMVTEVNNRKDKYYCPYCREEVILKSGKIRIPHFSHKVKNNCVCQNGESKAHLRCTYK